MSALSRPTIPVSAEADLDCEYTQGPSSPPSDTLMFTPVFAPLGEMETSPTTWFVSHATFFSCETPTDSCLRLISVKPPLGRATSTCTRIPRIPRLPRLADSVRTSCATLRPSGHTDKRHSCRRSGGVSWLGTPSSQTRKAPLGEVI